MEHRLRDLKDCHAPPAWIGWFSQCLETRGAAGMGHGQLPIALGVEALLGDGFGAELPFQRGRGAHDQGPRRHILGDHGSCGHQGP